MNLKKAKRISKGLRLVGIAVGQVSYLYKDNRNDTLVCDPRCGRAVYRKTKKGVSP